MDNIERETSGISPQLADEASRYFADMLKGNRPPEFYQALKAGLQKVVEDVGRLHENALTQAASQHSSDTENTNHARSAAAKLRQIHERSDRSSNSSTPISEPNSELVQLEVESFPALSSSTVAHNGTLQRSYARVVKSSNFSQPSRSIVVRASERHVPAEREGDEWIVVDRSSRGNRSSVLKTSSSPRKKNAIGASTLAAERQHAGEKHMRKSLPQGWMEMNEETQHPCRDAISLKSSPSKCTLSRATASETPSYASPTAASKHRTSASVDSEKAPSPQKAKSVRTRLVATPVFDGPHRKDLSTQDKRPAFPSSFGFDGVAEFEDTGVLQKPTEAITRQSAKKDRRDLKILVPDLPASLPRSASPSRIPIAIAASKTSSDVEPFALESRIRHAAGSIHSENGASKVRDRASILEPIKRRLSSLSSRSRSGSNASTVEQQRTADYTREATIAGDKIQQAFEETSSNVAVVDIGAHPKIESYPTTHGPSSNDASKSSSALLPNGSQNGAKDYVEHQNCSLGAKAVPAASSSTAKDAPQPDKLHDFKSACHSRQISCASSVNQDSGVLRQTHAKAQSSSAVQTTPATKFGSEGSSLRATAVSFTPMRACGLGAPPVTFPALPLLPSPAMLPTPPSTLLSSFTTTLPRTPIDGEASSLVSPQHPLPIINSPGLLYQGVWSQLPSEEQVTVIQQQERGLSPDSSVGLSSATISNMTYNSSFASPRRVPGMVLKSSKPGLNGIAHRQTESCPPVGFDRAPLPTDSGTGNFGDQRKGWDIGSAAPGWWYGWRGGDSLEISFRGDGPVAEKNVNAPINFHDYDRGSCDRDLSLPVQPHLGHGQYSSTSSGSSPERRVKRWVKKQGYRAVPCGQLNVIEAAEHLGVPATQGSIDGWCHDCWPH